MAFLSIILFTVGLGCVLADDTVEASNCYEHLGCFDNVYPFNNTGDLPLTPTFIGTTFRLFTRRNRRVAQILNPYSSTFNSYLQQSKFNKNVPTKFIIHGFLQNGRVVWVNDMVAELLQKDNVNVIAVDWGDGSGFPYSQAVANTRIVGAVLAFLIQSIGVPYTSLHLIGHSLGAHVAGYAGRRLQGIGRITGLDPAEPNYKGTDPRVRLDPTDASFVDVIHTDGSPFNYMSGYGLMDPSGHIDFYPNGGEHQPGCRPDNVENLALAAYYHGVEDASDEISCSHSRAISLFMESINSDCKFRGYPCASLAALDNNQDQCLSCSSTRGCPVMGYGADAYKTTSSGKYYLRTRDEDPYCGYAQEVTIVFGHFTRATTGIIHVTLVGSNDTTDYFTMKSGSRLFRGNQRRYLMYTDLQRLGVVNEVHVTFRRNVGLLARWFSYRSSLNTITVDMISIKSAETGQTYYFCGDTSVLRNGDTAILNQRSTNRYDC